jgi:hypothetical protein
MAYLTEERVRKAIQKKAAEFAERRELGELSKLLKVSSAQLSRAMHSGPISSKILAWAGYRKVKKLYEGTGR